MDRWRITVKVDGNPDWTIDNVPAETEGKAKTKAMVHYPYPLRGRCVEYVVEQKGAKA
jgi:hypothetical protein